MKLLADDLFCSMFMIDNPETKQPEIIIRFANFDSEKDAIAFAQAFKSQKGYTDLMPPEKEKVTIH